MINNLIKIKYIITAAFGCVLLVCSLCGCADIARSVQNNKLKATVQNLEDGTSIETVSSLLSGWLTNEEIVKARGVTYRVILINTGRQGAYGSDYDNKPYTPLVFKNDKLFSKSEAVYNSLKDEEKDEILLSRYGRAEFELIKRGQIAVGMSESALHLAFPNTFLKAEHHDFRGVARLYQVISSDYKRGYRVYVVNGMVTSFSHD